MAKSEFCGDEQDHERHEWMDGVTRRDCPGAPTMESLIAGGVEFPDVPVRPGPVPAERGPSGTGGTATVLCPFCGRTVETHQHPEGVVLMFAHRVVPTPHTRGPASVSPAEPQRGFRADLSVLLDAFADVPEVVRVLKVTEEAGEAAQAYIGVSGLNPRKGVTHSNDDLADELADVALTALVALGAFTADPIQRLTNRVAYVAARHRREVLDVR